MSDVNYPTNSDSARSTQSDRYLEQATHFVQQLFSHFPDDNFDVRLWDGSYPIRAAKHPADYTLTFNHAGAFRRMFLLPTELNLGEAFIFSDFDIEGDIVAATEIAQRFRTLQLNASEWAKLARQLLSFPTGYHAETSRPGIQLRGDKHSKARDQRAVRYHYDVSNDFYRLWLDENMAYSCAYFITGNEDIHTAQQQKFEHICRKLQLQAGETLLDIGCGWGGLVNYAVRTYGVNAVGVTLSKNQHAWATEHLGALIADGRAEIRIQDYRDIPANEMFDKVVSVGMVEHVGREKLPAYFQAAWNHLKPGGLFLNHGIGYLTSHEPKSLLWRRLVYGETQWLRRYVFPDYDVPDIHVYTREAEKVGFEVRDIEGLREHYTLTLRHWSQRLNEHRDEALEFIDEPTFRVWQLYMAGTAQSFRASRLSIYQSVLSKNTDRGESLQPWTRAHLYH